MKILKSKNTVGTILFSGALLMSASVTATQAPFEKVIAATIQVQGQKVINELSEQVASSIKAELARFSLNNNSINEQQIAKSNRKTVQQKQQTSEE